MLTDPTIWYGWHAGVTDAPYTTPKALSNHIGNYVKEIDVHLDRALRSWLKSTVDPDVLTAVSAPVDVDSGVSKLYQSLLHSSTTCPGQVHRKRHVIDSIAEFAPKSNETVTMMNSRLHQLTRLISYETESIPEPYLQRILLCTLGIMDGTPHSTNLQQRYFISSSSTRAQAIEGAAIGQWPTPARTQGSQARPNGDARSSQSNPMNTFRGSQGSNRTRKSPSAANAICRSHPYAWNQHTNSQRLAQQGLSVTG